MKKLIGTLLFVIYLFAIPVSNNDELYAISSLFEIGKEEIPDITRFNTINETHELSSANSMTTTDSIQVEFDELVRDFISDTTSISYKLLDGTSTGEFQNLPHGIVVDPEGKMWVGFYGKCSREFIHDDGRTINLRALHCFNPDGSPAFFSPIEFFEFPDGSKDTIYYESVANGSCRGLSMMDDGNILFTSWSTVFKIDYQTGNGLARWHPGMNGLEIGSMTEAAHDPDLGLIYVGRVIDNKPVYMLDENLNYLGIAIDTVPTLHRSILTRTRSDGISQIFSGTIWDGQGIFVYESSDPLTEKFKLVDTLANEVITTPTQTVTYFAWPSCLDWYDREKGILLYGNLYQALAFTNGEVVPNPKHASKWVFLDVDEDRQLGSFGVKAPSGSFYGGPYGDEYPDGSYSPRGASFVGNSIYTIDFNLHLLQKWQIFNNDDTVMFALTVSDSVNSTILTYGWAPDATDAYDEGLDEYDSLIAPLGSFDAHFSSNLITDMRAPNYSGSINWNFRFQEGEGNGPIELEWDSTAFPDYGQFYLKDSIGGSLININMRESSGYVAGEFSPFNLKILYFYKLKAEFTSDRQGGKAPLSVCFTDLSVGNISSWLWTFGDGETSQDKNPVHAYTKPEVYNVTLTINDGINYDEIVKTEYITVNYSDYPKILNIKDVPNDQGGWVCVDFSKSYYDTDEQGIRDSSSTGVEMYTVEISDNGIDWITANSTVAYGMDLYTVLVHTLYDSCAATSEQLSFRVIADMSEGNFISTIGTGYSVDNIAPPAPLGLMADIVLSGINITWNPSEAEDIKHYNVYRNMNGDLSNETALTSTSENSFTDNTAYEDNTYYYRITAVDIHDNEGKSSEMVSLLVGLGNLDAIPDNFELAQNYPNPFNPMTTLKYGLPEASDVKITIYDISGKKIMDWNFKGKAAGWHQVIWNGRDAHGNQVSTGMYIYSLYADDFTETMKMVLMK